MAEIDRRLARMRDDDPSRRTVLRARDRATLYLAAVSAGRADLIPESLYRGLLARTSPTTSIPKSGAVTTYEVPDRSDVGCSPTTVVTARGDLDSSTLPEFHRMLDHALSTSYHGVVVDLSAVEFISITAARELAHAARRAGRNRLDLRLVTGSAHLERTLTVTGTLSLFHRHDSLQSALGKGK
ncbi:STAS domain-containing protein [Speluncibacter jeojiensis]|uniref:Anti-sigma factor antagonist n=1 Tax=Speluncibacter jeojiensis TaxID=2710754 RepID=A0A9X4RG60_9ACTN|nr:STAS domain-containing protein [Corynebacteriales bacterium D3-21]